MGAKDGGVLAPNQFTTTKCFSKPFGLILGGFFYIGKKKKCIPTQIFLSGYKPAESCCYPASDSTPWLAEASKDTQRREAAYSGAL